jgi:hypothetical protein
MEGGRQLLAVSITERSDQHARSRGYTCTSARFAERSNVSLTE